MILIWEKRISETRRMAKEKTSTRKMTRASYENMTVNVRIRKQRSFVTPERLKMKLSRSI